VNLAHQLGRLFGFLQRSVRLTLLLGPFVQRGEGSGVPLTRVPASEAAEIGMKLLTVAMKHNEE
jgi:hypothetical protein